MPAAYTSVGPTRRRTKLKQLLPEKYARGLGGQIRKSESKIRHYKPIKDARAGSGFGYGGGGYGDIQPVRKGRRRTGYR